MIQNRPDWKYFDTIAKITQMGINELYKNEIQNTTMFTVKKKPNAALSGFVKNFWYFRIESHEMPCSQLSFPYGNFELICYLKNPNYMSWHGENSEFTEPDLFYAGQVTRPFSLKFDKPCECVGVSFHPWTGNLLFDLPASEFTNNLVPLCDLKTGSLLQDQLHNCKDENQLFFCLEDYLLKRLITVQPDPVVQSIILNLHSQNQFCSTPEPDLQMYDLSRRRIEQRFKEAVGISFLTYRRKYRFQSSLQAMKKISTEENLTTIGLQCGYYDQSHFIHDFKKFAGISPKQFLKNQNDLNGFLQSLV